MSTPVEPSLSRLLSARIRELRLEAEMTQEQLARRARTYRPLVARVERGSYTIRLSTVYRYAKALDVEPMVILCVLDEWWRDASGWSPEQVERWWPRRRDGTLRSPCRPAAAR